LFLNVRRKSSLIHFTNVFDTDSAAIQKRRKKTSKATQKKSDYETGASCAYEGTFKNLFFPGVTRLETRTVLRSDAEPRNAANTRL